MTPEELRQRTVLTVPEWQQVMAIKSQSTAYRMVADGQAEGAFKIGGERGTWRIPVAPLLRQLLMEDAPEEANVTQLRRAQ